MKKLSLLTLLLELQGGSGHRPDGVSKANQHKFPHHGLFGKFGGGKPVAPNTSPYPDKDSDIAVGDAGADIEPDTDELPLEAFMSEFKLGPTKSANDNTSFFRPSTKGSGPMAAYGRSSKAFGTFDPTANEVPFNGGETYDGEETFDAKTEYDGVPNQGSTKLTRDEKRKQGIKGMSSQKIGAFGDDDPDSESININNDGSIAETLYEMMLREFGIGARNKHPRDDNDYITKQPWASGMPGDDQKDIVNGDAKVDELMAAIDREERNGGRCSIERPPEEDEVQETDDELENDPHVEKQMGREDETGPLPESLMSILQEYGYAPGAHAKRSWSGTNHSQRLPRISKQAKSDMNFWNIISRDNVYTMTGISEFEEAQKERVGSREDGKEEDNEDS